MSEPVSRAHAGGSPERTMRELLMDATLEIRHLRQRVAALSVPASSQAPTVDEPIAIVGMACRFPGDADTPEVFWRNLMAGRDAMGPVPSDRWDNDALFDAVPSATGRVYTREAGFLSDVQGFDPLWFGMAPRDAERMDPQQRLLLELAHEALEDAGLPPFGLKGSATGVYVGICFDDYAQRLLRSGDLQRIDGAAALGNNRAVAAGRVAYTFGLQGPVLQLDTTCSSSLLAMHLACQSLRLGEADLALAGGVNLMLSAEATVGFCRLGALSADGRCRAFDAQAAGYARGEGGGLVVLKRLSKAQADGDRILAVWRGSAVNHDGASNGLTAPSGPAQVAVIREALRRAGLTPEQVQHVEAHGTATSLGDPIELMALQEAYGLTSHQQARAEPLWVSSVKTHIGHLESAAGAAGLIKAVLSVAHGHIPPHLHLSEPTPRVPWARMGLKVSAPGQAWPAVSGPRRAAVSGFGMSGTNVHVVLEQAPGQGAHGSVDKTPSQPALATRGVHVLAFGARHEAGLQACLQQWGDWLGPEGHPAPAWPDGQPAWADSDAVLAACCHHANRTRSQGAWRRAWVVSSLDDLRQQLARALAAAPTRRAVRPSLIWRVPARLDNPCALLRNLALTMPAGEDWLARCDAAYRSQGGAGLLEEAVADTPDGVRRQLAQQLAGLLGLSRLWRASGLSPDHIDAPGLARWVKPVVEGKADALAVFENTLATATTVLESAVDVGQMQALSPPAAGAETCVVDLAQPFLAGGDSPVARPWLDMLARLHDAGFDIDWTSVDAGFAVPHVALPRTAFVRRRCWVAPDALVIKPCSGDVDDAWMPGDNAALSDLDLRVRNSTVGLAASGGRAAAGQEHPRWAHHEVQAHALWPAAAHLASLWALARNAGWSDARVHSLSLMQGLWLPHAADAQVANAPVRVQALARKLSDEGGLSRWQARVASQGAAASPWQPTPSSNVMPDAASPPAWQVHVQAELSVAEKATSLRSVPEWAHFDSTSAPVGPDTWEGGTFYRRFADRGLVYGPDFAVIDTVSFDETRARARLRPGAHTVAVLDAGLQLAGLWLASSDQADTRISLPVAMEEAGLAGQALHGGLADATWVQAWRRGEDEHWQLDLSWHDAQGHLLAWTAGWRLMPVRTRQATPPLQVQTWASSLCEMQWVPRERASASGSAPWSRPDQLVAQALQPLAALWQGDDCRASLQLQPWLTSRALAWALHAVIQLDAQAGAASDSTDPEARLGGWGLAPAQSALARRLIVLADRARAQGVTPATVLEATGTGAPISREQQVLDACGAQLPGIVSGDVDPLSLLFPGGDLGLLTALYEQAPGARVMNTQVREALRACVSAWQAAGRTDPLRIVEIGAGTGGTTAHLLPLLADAGVPVAYTFTDVSAHFLNAAQERFANQPWLTVELLDIERDPHAQGRLQADVVVAANVLHATTRIDRTLDHVRRLLAPSGTLILLEATEALPWLDLVFGTTAGWWAFQDAARRPVHPLLTAEAWQAALREAGFDAVAALEPPQALPQTVLVARRGHAALTRWAVRCEGDDARSGHAAASLCGAGVLAQPLMGHLQDDAILSMLPHVEAVLWCPAEADDPARELQDACEQLGALATALSHLDHPPRLVVWTPNVMLDPLTATPKATCLADGLWGAVQSIRAECPGLVVHFVQSAGSALPLAALLEDAAPEAALRQAPVRPQRAQSVRAPADPIADHWLVPRLVGTQAPLSHRWVGDGVSLAGLRTEVMGLPPLADTAVRIRVKAAGLNFRDVLIAMGEYPHPDPQRPDPLGAECVGVVEAVGRAVSGLHPGQPVMALATGTFAHHVDVPADLVSALPRWQHDQPPLTWEDAATLPVAFATAWHALVECADLKAGERVLIHSAAGGVGQAAVQIARSLGAEVFGTASQTKWPALQALGITAPMDSRQPGFASQVHERTAGRGVDVVLNALPGALQRESLQALQPHGRFVEIGKGAGLDDADFSQMAPLVRLHRIDLAQLTRQSPQRALAWWQALSQAVRDGHFQALPSQTWPMADAVTALRTLQQARHVGKLVLLADGVQPGERPLDKPTPPVFTPRGDGGYLVTGGLSGLGLLTARWLAQRGAGELILLGRTLPEAVGGERLQAWQEAMADMQSMGVRVHAAAVDVADEQALTQLLKAHAAGHLPGLTQPLRGIFHAAGVLDDAPLANQHAQRLKSALQPKVAGAWHLHRLTATQPLEAFVLFASAAGVLGAPGQFNHAAANAWLDGFARWRRAQGQPAHSVAWGAWADIGSALQYARQGQVSGLAGVGYIAPDEGLAVLAQVLQDARPQLTAMAVDWPRLLAHPWARRSALLDTLRDQHAVKPTGLADRPRVCGATPPSGVKQGPVSSAAAEAFRRHLREADAATRARLLDELVSGLVAETLGLSLHEVDRHAGFFDLGLDSLTALEIKNRLQATLGLSLPGTLAFDHPTPSALVAHLDQRMVASATSIKDVPVALPAPAALPETMATAAATGHQPHTDIAAQLDARLDALDVLLSDPTHRHA